MSDRVPVSAVVITLNEADRLPRTLDALSWADEILVVDAGSQDGTRDLAAAAGAQVLLHPWEGYSRQKAFAVARARHRWILWIDADEEVSPQLRRSIEAALSAQATGGGLPSAYAMNRRTNYLGRFLRFGGWYPDRKVRLFDREQADFDGNLVHEELRVAGTVGFLPGELWHYSYRNLEHHIRKTHEMARLWAAQERDRRKVSAWDLTVRPAATALKSYLVRGGLLEGWRGLVVAGVASYSVWLKYALLSEMQRPAATKGGEDHAGKQPTGSRSRRDG